MQKNKSEGYIVLGAIALAALVIVYFFARMPEKTLTDSCQTERIRNVDLKNENQGLKT